MTGGVFAAAVLAAYAVLVNWRYFSCHRKDRYAGLEPIPAVLVERSRQAYVETYSVTRSCRSPVREEEWDYVRAVTDRGSEVICCKYPCPPEKKRRRHPLPEPGSECAIYLLDNGREYRFQYAEERYQYDRITCLSLVTLILTDFVVIAGEAAVLIPALLSLAGR
jgi:hypothetical protein